MPQSPSLGTDLYGSGEITEPPTMCSWDIDAFLVPRIGSMHPKTLTACLYCNVMFGGLQIVQLWRLLVTSAICPDPWTKERTDERKLELSEARQFGGFRSCLPLRQDESWWRAAARSDCEDLSARPESARKAVTNAASPVVVCVGNALAGVHPFVERRRDDVSRSNR